MLLFNENNYNFATLMKINVLNINLIFIFFILFFAESFAQDSISSVNLKDTILKVEIQKDTLKNPEKVNDIISFAKKFLGTPYRYAGTTPSGFDCSGFVSYVMGNFGFSLVHSSYGMAEFGQTVRLAEIKPGDLMFFKGSNVNSTRIGHVALVVEVKDNVIRFIHASNGKGVTIDTFNGSRYYVPRFVKAKRLDYGGR